MLLSTTSKTDPDSTASTPSTPAGSAVDLVGELNSVSLSDHSVTPITTGSGSSRLFNEGVHLIYSYLTTTEWVSAMNTCSKWYELAGRSPSRHMSWIVDLNDGQLDYPLSDTYAHLPPPRLRYHITEPLRKHMSTSHPRLAVTIWKLKTIFRLLPNIDTISFSLITTMGGYHAINQHALEIEWPKSLHTLSLELGLLSYPNLIQSVCTRIPGLTNLSIGGISTTGDWKEFIYLQYATRLTSLRLSSIATNYVDVLGGCQITQLPPGLTYCDITSGVGSFHHLVEQKLSSLQQLDLSSYTMKSGDLAKLAEAAPALTSLAPKVFYEPELKHLGLFKCLESVQFPSKLLDPHTTGEAFAECHSLTQLKFHYDVGPTAVNIEKWVECVSKAVPKLLSLIVTYRSLLDIRLFMSFKHLQRLELIGSNSDKRYPISSLISHPTQPLKFPKLNEFIWHLYYEPTTLPEVKISLQPRLKRIFPKLRRLHIRRFEREEWIFEPPPKPLVGIETNPGPFEDIPTSSSPSSSSSIAAMTAQRLFKDGLLTIVSFLDLIDTRSSLLTCSSWKTIVACDRTCRQVTIEIDPRSKELMHFSRRYLSSPLKSNITSVIYDSDTTILTLYQLIQHLPNLTSLECTFTDDSYSVYQNRPLAELSERDRGSIPFHSNLLRLVVYWSDPYMQGMKKIITSLCQSLPILAPKLTDCFIERLATSDCIYLTGCTSLVRFSMREFIDWSNSRSSTPQPKPQVNNFQFVKQLHSFQCTYYSQELHKFFANDLGVFQYLPRHLPMMREFTCGRCYASVGFVTRLIEVMPNLTALTFPQYEISALALVPHYSSTLTSLTLDHSNGRIQSDEIILPHLLRLTHLTHYYTGYSFEEDENWIRLFECLPDLTSLGFFDYSIDSIQFIGEFPRTIRERIRSLILPPDLHDREVSMSVLQDLPHLTHLFIYDTTFGCTTLEESQQLFHSSLVLAQLKRFKIYQLDDFTDVSTLLFEWDRTSKKKKTKFDVLTFRIPINDSCNHHQTNSSATNSNQTSSGSIVTDPPNDSPTQATPPKPRLVGIEVNPGPFVATVHTTTTTAAKSFFADGLRSIFAFLPMKDFNHACQTSRWWFDAGQMGPIRQFRIDQTKWSDAVVAPVTSASWSLKRHVTAVWSSTSYAGLSNKLCSVGALNSFFESVPHLISFSGQISCEDGFPYLVLQPPSTLVAVDLKWTIDEYHVQASIQKSQTIIDLISEVKTLTSLRLQNYLGRGIRLEPLAHLPRLSTLSLTTLLNADPFRQFIQPLNQFKSLTSLSIRDGNFYHEHRSGLIQLYLPNITLFDLFNTELDQSMLEILSQSFPSLTQLITAESIYLPAIKLCKNVRMIWFQLSPTIDQEQSPTMDGENEVRTDESIQIDCLIDSRLPLTELQFSYFIFNEPFSWSRLFTAIPTLTSLLLHESPDNDWTELITTLSQTIANKLRKLSRQWSYIGEVPFQSLAAFELLDSLELTFNERFQSYLFAYQRLDDAQYLPALNYLMLAHRLSSTRFEYNRLTGKSCQYYRLPSKPIRPIETNRPIHR